MPVKITVHRQLTMEESNDIHLGLAKTADNDRWTNQEYTEARRVLEAMLAPFSDTEEEEENQKGEDTNYAEWHDEQQHAIQEHLAHLAERAERAEMRIAELRSSAINPQWKNSTHRAHTTNQQQFQYPTIPAGE